MLASITPLGERGRHTSWALTVSAFLIGATAAGAALGALLGAFGSLLPAMSDSVREAIFAAAALVAFALDAGRRRTPGPNRQVNERWRDQYRGWVYGLGYGAQLGLGVTTVVSSAATYLAMWAAFLSGSGARGALIMGVFGLVRGLTLLAAAGVRAPEQLLALHRWLARWRTTARLASTGLLVAICALAIAEVLV
jgi:sulfite exporter TauE/SafE